MQRSAGSGFIEEVKSIGEQCCSFWQSARMIAMQCGIYCGVNKRKSVMVFSRSVAAGFLANPSAN
jgi:hypothetical protein